MYSACSRVIRDWTRQTLLWLALAGGARAGGWVELRTPNFTVVSEASERRTHDWAVQFEIFRRALVQVLPLDTRYADPLTIVIFTSDRHLKPYKPQENNKAAAVAGYFGQGGGRSYIAISIEGARDDVRELVFHEATHWHLTAAPRTFPLWFNEGLAEVFGNFVFRGSTFTIGSFRPGYRRYILTAKPMPFSELAAFGDDGMQYNGQQRDRTQLFYVQSWLLVHNLMFGEGGVGRVAIAKYVIMPPVSADPIEDVDKGLGAPVGAYDRRIAAYLDHGRFGTLKMPFNRNAIEDGFELRPASDGLIDLTLSHLLLNVHRAKDALPLLQQAVAAMPQDPRPYEALAAASENEVAAAEPARQALALGSRNYWVHLLLAESAIKAGKHDVDKTEAMSVATGELVECLDLNPRCIIAANMLATMAEFIPVISVPVAKHLAQAAFQYPANPQIQLGMGFVELRGGELAKARARLAAVQSRVDHDTDGTRAAAKRLGEAIEQHERELLQSEHNSAPLLVPSAGAAG